MLGITYVNLLIEFLRTKAIINIIEFILNKIFNVGENILEDWFVFGILLWFFLFILHFINVFITKKFMDRNWERKQIEKLVKKQEIKIAELEKEVVNEMRLKIEADQYAAELKKKETQTNNLNQEHCNKLHNF